MIEQEKMKGDVAIDHELGFVVMNLIAIEEHLACTIGKTKNDAYLELYNQVRALRSKRMGELVNNREGESWCVAKHLLASSMRLMETGIKYGALGESDKAVSLFVDAMDAFQVFLVLQRMGDTA